MRVFNFYANQLSYVIIRFCVPFVIIITIATYFYSIKYDLNDNNLYKIDVLFILLLIAFAILHLGVYQVGAL